jgi:flagellar assembly factor FliW
MRIQSNRFGSLDVPPERVLHFVRPIVGFDAHSDFTLIEDPETAPVLWLQALDAPDVLFPLVDLALVADGPAPPLDDETAAALGAEAAGETRMMGILTLNPDPAAISVNLRAPVVVNQRRGAAAQFVIEDPDLPVHHPVRAAPGASRRNKEVRRAGTHTPQG